LAAEIQLDILTSPYQLYSQIPKGGTPKSAFAKKIKPGMGKALRAEAALENIEINYKNIERVPRSFKAHRLVSLAADNSKKWTLAKQIFHDYFELGQDIEDLDYLLKKGQLADIPKSILSEFLLTKIGESAVLEKLKQHKEEFITIVPTLRLDGKFVVPGLQSADVWEKYIRRAAEIQMRT
jgi:predicted DsbA family dithiol-disulfide isomerase